MACEASRLIEEVTAHVQSDSLEDAREIRADGTYFPNNLHIIEGVHKHFRQVRNTKFIVIVQIE